jgi:hypothetical protein
VLLGLFTFSIFELDVFLPRVAKTNDPSLALPAETVRPDRVLLPSRIFAALR